MNRERSRIETFVKLGNFIRAFCEYSNSPGSTSGSPWFERLQGAVRTAGHQNGWFTEENVMSTLRAWGAVLTAGNIDEWISKYELSKHSRKSIAIIMAGNIPLVGFHDFLCVLITGHTAIVKLSDGDRVLLPVIADYLMAMEPYFGDKIEFVEGKLNEFDAVIATGSNNTARYFEYYFGHWPNIIRKNRNSVAVLRGEETPEQLIGLGRDIFQYYGLGCRSVSKIFVPQAYDFKVFFESIVSYENCMDLVKYANNYDYNKAVYLMSDFKILDNGFLILKEDIGYHSPIASLNYEFFSSEPELMQRLSNDKDELQCVVACGFMEKEVEFGRTQTPALSDYADGIDTLDFLLSIK